MIYLPDGVSLFPRFCLPIVSPYLLLFRHNIYLYWMAIVSPHVCLSLTVSQPWCVRFPAVLFLLVSLYWMVHPPSQGLVSIYLPSSFLFLFVGWCVRLFDFLFPLVSHCLSFYVSLCWMVCRFPQGLVSIYLSFFPIVHLIASHCLPSCFPVSRRLRLCFIVSYHFLICMPVMDGVFDMDYNRLQETLSPHVSHCLPYVRLCWMLCPPSRGLVSFCLPLSPHMYACVGRYVPLPKVLSPLVSHSFSICVPVMFCVGWYVRLPAVLFPLFPSLSLSWSSFLSPNMSPNMSVFLFPFVVGGLILHFFSNSELIGVLNVFLRCLPWCWTVCPPARGLVSYLISQFISLLVSLYGGWFHFAFFPKECAIEGS